MQQRLGSTRFPNKAKAIVAGKTITQHVVERAARAVGATNVVLAHPKSDDFSWCDSYPCQTIGFGGEESDLLDRMWRAHTMWSLSNGPADIIVRLTGDTPFVPVKGILDVVEAVESGFDYAETRSDPSLIPNGIDAQAFTREVMDQADLTEQDKEAREHVTPAVLRVAKKPFRSIDIEGVILDRLPPFRLTVDYEDDLKVLEKICQLMETDRPTFQDVVSVYMTSPHLFTLDQTL